MAYRHIAGRDMGGETENSMSRTAGQNPSPRSIPRGGTPVYLVALASLIAHLLTAGRYGFHRDELYYIACGMHPAWGYVDHPALTPLLARLAVALFGGSLVGLRLLAALAAAAVIVLTGQIAREMGGGRFASALAAVAVAVGTIFVSAGHLFQTVPFDQVVWAVAALLLAHIVARDDGAGWPWLALGATLGVGVHTKSTVVALGVGIVAGVLLTPMRRWLRTRWPWLGALLAAAIALPNLLWQATHGWPTLAFSRNSAAAYWHGRSPALFLLLQPVFVGVGGFALACVGLWWCFSARGRRFRAFGWLFVAAVVVLLAARGKEYYPAPAYLPLIAAGGMAATGLFRGGDRALPAVHPRRAARPPRPYDARRAAVRAGRGQRRADRLAGVGRDRQRGVPTTAARRASARANPDRELGRGGRGGLLRRAVRVAARHQRPGLILPVGAR